MNEPKLKQEYDNFNTRTDFAYLYTILDEVRELRKEIQLLKNTIKRIK